MKRITKLVSLLVCMSLVIGVCPITAYALSSGTDLPEPVLQVQNVSITEDEAFSLNESEGADAVRALHDGTILVSFQSTGSGQYQSLFSVSGSAAENTDRHFHIYITPGGTLGMELRNTDSVFKYTMSAANALNVGETNTIAFSADSASGSYKLFANGDLVAEMEKDNYVFLDDILGTDMVSLGATVRTGNNYHFAGTIYEACVYDSALNDDVLTAATSPEEPPIDPDPTEDPTLGRKQLFHVEDVVVTEGTPYDLSADTTADEAFALTEGTLIVRYQGNSTNQYQSLFSVSGSAAANTDRYFHVYVTPNGTLGMELRNTDRIFKYTMSAPNVLQSGMENIIAFSADSMAKTYKLFANGELVATLAKEDFKFISDIDGLDSISLGATVRTGNSYYFGGTIFEASLYNYPMSDAELIEATSAEIIPDPTPDQGEVNLVRENLTISAGTVEDLTNAPDADGITEMNEGTIVVRFTRTSTNQVQSLFSVANGTSGNSNRHFHVYVTPDGTLGYEIRNTDGDFKYSGSRASAVRAKYLNEDAENIVAFRADSNSKTYTLFSNGQKIKEFSIQNWKFISDITGLDHVSIGGTIRNGAVAYSFGGNIASLSVTNEVLTDNELLAVTGEVGYGEYIFGSNDGLNCNYYRIPTLLTLQSGRVVAGADARFGGTHDSKSNIDTAFAYSDDNGQTWSNPILPFHFVDYADQQIEWPTAVGLRDLQIQGSASFIDASMVQDAASGRLYMFVDVMPAGVGSPNASIGNGYKEISGNKYLQLRWYQDGNSTYNYSVRENGVIYDDRTNTPTEYTVNPDFEVLQNGQPLMVTQYSVDFDGSALNEFHNGNSVPMNVFYKDSLFKVYPTSYLGMKYSDDEGRTWSSMQLLNTLKPAREKLLITGPGVGIQIKNGAYAGRLVVPVYSVTLAGFGVLYSDNGGTSWNYAAADSYSTGATAEAQIVEMPDGSLKVFLRTSGSIVAIRTSIDGGVTWSSETAMPGISTTSYGTQISAVNYSGLVDGYPAILVSSPNATNGRNTGMIRVGLIKDTGGEGIGKYNIEWRYAFEVDGHVGYSYSCLSELQNGEVGLLYEKYDSWSRGQLHMINVLPFEVYSISDLISN